MTQSNSIFHYTSVETLALILSSRKIRFSRLDGVDDALEAPIIDGIYFNKYFFVSCWTTQPIESIPQWHLYTDKMTGVRIELPSYPFEHKLLTPPATWTNYEQQGEMFGPIDLSEMYKPTYMLLPTFMNVEQFGGLVEYVNDVEQRYRESVLIDKTKGHISISRPHELIRFKTKNWEFQSEYRFGLFALPSLVMPTEGPGTPSFYNNIAAHMTRSLLTGVSPGIHFIDVDLNSSALSKLVVTTGPLCSAGVKLCVESLVKQYAPQARVQPSEFEGSVRSRR